MRRKPEEKQQSSIQKVTISEDRVHLPVLLGLKPGIYLSFIYALVILIILFFILLYPGLSRPGSMVIFKTEPYGAALKVDGIYMGTAPDKIFVSKGHHSMEAVLPGFEAQKIECDIPGRTFASVIFPKKFPLEITLEITDPVAVFSESAADYAAWTFGGEATASWQIPLSLSEGAYRIGKYGDSPVIEELLAASARFAVTKAAVRDLVRAKFLSNNGGLSPSPASLYHSSSDILHFLSNTPGAAAWLKNIIPTETVSILENSSWYKKQIAAGSVTTIPITEIQESALETSAFGLVEGTTVQLQPPAGRLNLGGLFYTGIKGGIDTNNQLNGFMICETEVSLSAYETFLTTNNRWSIDQKENLISQGLVSSAYLIDDKPPSMASSSITGVSWYAAMAYCNWLSTRLPLSMNNYEVRLPYETEWEYVARLNNNPDSSSVAAAPVITGSMWEWCADPYVPLNFIPAASRAIDAIASPERSLRGGSNSADPQSFATRASLPPEFCSSFVSFRPVIALKNPANSQALLP